jgi:hypothetical protein
MWNEDYPKNKCLEGEDGAKGAVMGCLSGRFGCSRFDDANFEKNAVEE